MKNPKLLIVSALVGFVLSFFIALIAGAPWHIVFLRSCICAVCVAAFVFLASLIIAKFLPETMSSDAPASNTDEGEGASVGTTLDILVDDFPAETSGTVPQFQIKQGAKSDAAKSASAAREATLEEIPPAPSAASAPAASAAPVAPSAPASDQGDGAGGSVEAASAPSDRSDEAAAPESTSLADADMSVYDQGPAAEAASPSPAASDAGSSSPVGSAPNKAAPPSAFADLPDIANFEEIDTEGDEDEEEEDDDIDDLTPREPGQRGGKGIEKANVTDMAKAIQTMLKTQE